MQRFSEDQGHTNKNDNFLLDFCKQTGLRIMNGHVGSDYGKGKYTFVGHRGRRVVDYVLAKPNIFKFIELFIYMNQTYYQTTALLHLVLNLALQSLKKVILKVLRLFRANTSGIVT